MLALRLSCDSKNALVKHDNCRSLWPERELVVALNLVRAAARGTCARCSVQVLAWTRETNAMIDSRKSVYGGGQSLDRMMRAPVALANAVAFVAVTTSNAPNLEMCQQCLINVRLLDSHHLSPSLQLNHTKLAKLIIIIITTIIIELIGVLFLPTTIVGAGNLLIVVLASCRSRARAGESESERAQQIGDNNHHAGGRTKFTAIAAGNPRELEDLGLGPTLRPAGGGLRNETCCSLVADRGPAARGRSEGADFICPPLDRSGRSAAGGLRPSHNAADSLNRRRCEEIKPIVISGIDRERSIGPMSTRPTPSERHDNATRQNHLVLRELAKSSRRQQRPGSDGDGASGWWKPPFGYVTGVHVRSASQVSCRRRRPNKSIVCRSQLATNRNALLGQICMPFAFAILVFANLDNAHCSESIERGGDLGAAKVTSVTNLSNSANVTSSQLVARLGLLNLASGGNSSAVQQAANRNSSQAPESRWDFGQRLVNLGSGPASNRSSLLSRTLRHLNGKRGKSATGPSGESDGKTLLLPSSDGSLGSARGLWANGSELTVVGNKSKRDYDTIQISDSGQQRDLALAAAMSNSSRSSGGRPNLPLDTWARLMNLRNVNKNGAAWPLLGAAVPATRGVERTQRSKTTLNLAHGKNSGGNLVDSSTEKGSADSSTSSSVVTVPYTVHSAQESLSIGIVIQPASNETVAHPNELRAANADRLQPDWQASNDIEHVIRATTNNRDDDETKKHASAAQRAVGSKEETNEEGQRSKGRDESGHWTRERSGAEGEQGHRKEANKEAAGRLVDVGHNRHGWKNVYHKEEYAQHQKYHDVFRDKDWHDKRAKSGESQQYEKGNKFNESLAKSYADKDRMGSKYDYRKGNEWKRSEENGAADDESQQLAAAAADEGDEGEQPKSHQASHQDDHQRAASSNARSVNRVETGDNLDDDAILNQMKVRLENMSEQFGEGAHGDQRRAAASLGSYELERPALNLTGGWSANGLELDEPVIQSVTLRGRDKRPKGQRSEASRLKGELAGGWEAGDKPNRPRLVSQLADEPEDSENDDDEEAQLVVLDPEKKPAAEQAQQVVVAQGEDKRNGLRLKLELDLGKSSMVNQVPVASDGGEQHNKEGGSLAKPTLAEPKQSVFTNSLGHSIKSSVRSSARETALPSSTTAASLTVNATELPPVWRTARVVGSGDGAKREHRSDRRPSDRDQMEEGKSSEVGPQAPKDSLTAKGQSLGRLNSRVQQSNLPTANERGKTDTWPSSEVPPLSSSSKTSMPAIRMLPSWQLGHKVKSLERPIEQTDHVGTFDFKTGSARNKLILARSPSLALRGAHSDHLPIGLWGDDFSISSAVTPGGDLYSAHKLSEAGLLRASPRRHAQSSLAHDRSGRPQSLREYTITFGRDDLDDLEAHNRRQQLDQARQLLQSGSDHYVSRHAGEPPIFSPPPFTANHFHNRHVAGPYLIGDEPNMIFETAASNIYGEMESGDELGLQAPPVEHHRLRPTTILSSLPTSHDSDNQRQLAEHRKQHEAAMMNEHLNYDYSMAHLTYVTAPPPLLSFTALSSAPVDDDSTGESLYLLGDGRDAGRLVSGRPKLSASSSVVASHQQTWDRAPSKSATAAARPQQQQRQPPPSPAQPTHQLPTTANDVGGRPAPSGQPGARPMISTIRNHLMPLGGLFKTASSINHALLSQQTAGVPHTPAPLAQSHPVQTSTGTTPAGNSAISKWLRLPRRVIDNHHHQRLRRYKQMAASSTSAPNPYHSSQPPEPISSSQQHQWKPLKPLSSSQPQNRKADSMQAQFSFQRVSHVALGEITPARGRNSQQPGSVQGQSKSSLKSDELDGAQSVNLKGGNRHKALFQGAQQWNNRKQPGDQGESGQSSSGSMVLAGRLVDHLDLIRTNSRRSIRLAQHVNKMPPLMLAAIDVGDKATTLSDNKRKHLAARSAPQTGRNNDQAPVHALAGPYQSRQAAQTRALDKDARDERGGGTSLNQRQQQSSATNSLSHHLYHHPTISAAQLNRLFLPTLNLIHQPMLLQAHLPFRMTNMSQINQQPAPTGHSAALNGHSIHNQQPSRRSRGPTRRFSATSRGAKLNPARFGDENHKALKSDQLVSQRKVKAGTGNIAASTISSIFG